jgi:thymidylate synthase
MNDSVLSIYRDFYKESKPNNNKEWQSIAIDPKNTLYELYNVNASFDNIKNPVEYFNPDLPWAEDHFQERICGKPINPGKQYKNWPYYKNLNNDQLFRNTGQFSHNYMERYWCSDIKGRRYNYGSLNDIIERLKDNPYNRQSFLSVWHPEDQSNNKVRVPCTIGYWFYMQDEELNVNYLIRSCDIVRHFKNDCYMTYRLLQHVCDKTKLAIGNLNMWIGSLHCFKSDLYYIKKYVRDTNN